MLLDVIPDQYPQIYIRIKLTILPGFEPLVPPYPNPGSKDYALSHNFVQAVVKQSLNFLTFL